MCGRYQLSRSPEEIAKWFGTKNPVPNYPARYNIAPTDPVLAVRFNRKTGERTLDPLRWGLVPHWAKDMKIGARTINARCETLSTTPAFRDAFEGRRCLIPAAGFYEWKREGGTKVPYAIVPRDEPMFALAGLWENWRDRNVEGAEWIRTCTIITGPPNEAVAPIHDRMPVILPRNAWAKWLGEEPANQDELQDMLKPYPSVGILIYPISSRVNSVKNDDAALIEPVTAFG